MGKSSKRILLLIGINPPHGLKYHTLPRRRDSYPDGYTKIDLNDMVHEIEAKHIDLAIVNIGDFNGLQKLAADFKKRIHGTNVECRSVFDEKTSVIAIKDILSNNAVSNQEEEKKTDDFGWFTDTKMRKTPVLIIKQCDT